MWKRNSSMRIILFFIECFCVVFSFPVDARDREDLAIREMRIEIEDFRRRLDRASSEFTILDSRLRDQTGDLVKLQAFVKSDRGVKSGEIILKMGDFDRRLAVMEEEQKGVFKDLRRIAEHINAVSKSLTQHSDKIASLEKDLNNRDKRLEGQLAELKKGVSSLITLIDKEVKDESTYIVRSGDYLEKIAEEHNTSIKAIKALNHLKSDLIFVGQKLIIP